MKRIVFPKLSKVFLLLFLLFLPTQLGKHFWLSGSVVWGLRVDYLAPTMFLTDLFFLAWLITGLMGGAFSFLEKIYQYKKFVLTGLFLAAANVLVAANRPAAVYGWVKMGEFFTLIWLVKENKPFIYRHLGWLVPTWLSVETFLVVGQAWRQASLGGAFWWLGERSFGLSTPGIAKVSLAGRLFLRPYGSFSHPNSLAGFVLVLVFLALALSISGQRRRYCLALSVIILGLAFSRASLFAGAFLFVFWLKRRKKIGRFLLKFLVLGLALFLAAVVLKLRFSLAVFYRFLLAAASIKMIFFHPFGVGMRNFVVRLPDFWPSEQMNYLFFQPVHNIYLLWFAQTGIPGIFWIFWIFWQLLRKRLFFGELSFVFLAILLTGLFDHYWLTLQQNFLLMGLVIGLL